LKVKIALMLVILLGLGSPSCTVFSDSPKEDIPERRIEYLGNNTFRWGEFEGRHLVSTIPDFSQHFPSIRTDGVFEQLDARLAVLKNDEVADVQYEAPAGDILEVDFSQYEPEGLVTVTRRKADVRYVSQVLISTPEGLAIVESDLVPLPEADLKDVMQYGDLFFSGQAPSMEEAEHRFFAAAATTPRLGLTYLQKVFQAATDTRNKALYEAAEAYRQRLVLIQELK